MAPATVSAAECTDKQVKMISGYDLKPLERACPALFAANPKVPNPSKPETITKASLAEMSSCKTNMCISELTKLVANLPDCTIGGLSDKRTFATTVNVCKAFNAGEVTVAMATSMFNGGTKKVVRQNVRRNDDDH
jgi:hypothetical protein